MDGQRGAPPNKSEDGLWGLPENMREKNGKSNAWRYG